MLLEDDLLLDDSFHPHTGMQTVETLGQLQSQVLEYPLCSLDFGLFPV